MNTQVKYVFVILSLTALITVPVFACPQGNNPTAIADIDGYSLGDTSVTIDVDDSLTFKGDRSYDNDEGGLSISTYKWYVWEDGSSCPSSATYTSSSYLFPHTFNSDAIYYVKLRVIDDEGAYSTSSITGLNLCTITVGDAVAQPMVKGPYLIYGGDNEKMTVLWQTNGIIECDLELYDDTNYSNLHSP